MPELGDLWNVLRVDLDIFLDTESHSKSDPIGNKRQFFKDTQVDA